MGIIWNSTMPLLSTLAALVIIVHSAEEDTLSEYTRDLRPRIVDTAIHSYEQPWRVVDSEPVMKKSTQTNTWNSNSTEESQKHRRPGRKRKRRPQTPLTDSLAPQETNNYPEEPLRPNFEVDLINTEQSGVTPKRRRKKLESKSFPWTDVSLQRPLRRRGQRRKRPSLKIWPELSEFNNYRSEDNSPITTASSEKKEMADINPNDGSRQFISNLRNFNDGELLEEDLLTKESENSEKEKSKDEFRLFTKEKDSHSMQHRGPYLQEDKSLSEFSSEVMHHAYEQKNKDENENLRQKLNEKSTGVYNEYEKAQIDDPVDPITLKDILKRSNGTSLSEILQLHNLSLADLLDGKENAISILKSKSPYETKQKVPVNIVNNTNLSKVNTENSKQLVENGVKENLLLHLETKYVTTPVAEFSITTQSTHGVKKEVDDKIDNVKTTTTKPENNTNNIISIRRYPLGARRKLYIRPIINSTHKSPLSRDLIALNTRKYLNQRRNVSKSIEWRNVIPSVINISNTDGDIKKQIEISTVQITTEHLETQIDVENQTQSLLDGNNKRFDIEVETDTIFSTTSVQPDNTSENPVLLNETRYFMSTIKPVPITQSLQRHTFNNRMKKKRRRQKNTTTDFPKNKIVIYSVEKENLPLSTDITVKSQEPKLKQEYEDFVTILEDFMTTQTPSNLESTLKSVKHSSISSTTVMPRTTTHRINEKTAKIEIDEIFKDIQTSARLSKILLERNMTLRELVEHRERGSSHIHLADIFHNASKEPNPPEPFLSKSVIEPISKETYPLRAILEANAHDATIKPIINDPSILHVSYINIPVVMDFGNNVNENAENMGIMSLFNNFTKSVKHNNTFEQDFELKSYETDMTQNRQPTVRQNRVLTVNANQDDVVSWNEIFSLMRKSYKNESKDLLESIQDEPTPQESPSKIILEDVDDDSLIVLEDVQHLKSFDTNVSPDSNGIDINSLEGKSATSGNFEKIPSQTKPITVITASIAGLTMVLFLLIYAVFKWKQRKVVSNKDLGFCNERIPTPVFENRKRQKNHSSTRSISPMLSTSNIYTLNTLDSHNGKDSPEYMWDTLRKPFQ